ncbi:MAG: hypothetical protein LBC51_05775 [Treponema sp.]|jgi:hypothetical protein|nr:hypothetical protein [Treponema sp.]
MYDKESYNASSYTSPKVLAKQGLAAVGGIVGGAGLLLMGALPPIAGILLGAVAGIAGIGALLSKDPQEKKPGAIITVAGGLAILSRIGIPVIKPLAGAFLGLGALGFFAMGIWNGIQFFKGLKRRG